MNDKKMLTSSVRQQTRTAEEAGALLQRAAVPQPIDSGAGRSLDIAIKNNSRVAGAGRNADITRGLLDPGKQRLGGRVACKETSRKGMPAMRGRSHEQGVEACMAPF